MATPKFDISKFAAHTDTRRGHLPVASIRANAQLGLNAGAIDRFKLEGYANVVLYFNAEDQQVGVRLLKADETAEGATSLRVTGKDTKVGTVAAKSFFDKNSISYGGKTRRYRVECVDVPNAGPFLFFDLKEPLNGEEEGEPEEQ
jgi:hypothetical protein